MRILVTGANGFVGGHAMRDLRAAGHTPLPHVFGSHELEGEVFEADLSEPDAARELVAATRPDACLHLAGIAFVPMGWKNPRLVFEVNVIGALNILEALRDRAPKARVLVVTSAEVYGRRTRGAPVKESDPLRPDNLYAVSKAAADEACRLYTGQYGLPVMTARPHNHIGPGQSPDFVASSFARQLLQIAAGKKESVLRVGNLESARDFTDVRDVVRAYRLILERGTPGQAYNIASGKTVPIASILDLLCEKVGVHPRVQIDPDRFRPTDEQLVLDTSLIREELGWTPEIPLKQTLGDIVSSLREDTPTG